MTYIPNIFISMYPFLNLFPKVFAIFTFFNNFTLKKIIFNFVFYQPTVKSITIFQKNLATLFSFTHCNIFF